jgi:NADH:ubiquinone oxidoreductase subunit E
MTFEESARFSSETPDEISDIDRLDRELYAVKEEIAIMANTISVMSARVIQILDIVQKEEISVKARHDIAKLLEMVQSSNSEILQKSEQA